MSDDKRDYLLGLLFGGLIGAVLGILYAPKSGKEMREDIKDKANELLGNETLKDIKGKANELLGKAKEEYKRVSEKTADAIQSKTDRFKKAIDAGMEAYKEGSDK